ncbi:MAG: hypothetical protein ABSG04_15515, partial [Verrucomicrobiota bacterium]
DFISAQGNAPMPVLFVTVGDKDFGDGREGYNLANPPADNQVLERVEKWWQLSGFLSDWIKTPGEGPGILIGINGSPGRQIVIASILIDRAAWKNSEDCPDGGGKIRVPTIAAPKLDAFGLRARRVDKAAGLAFEGIPAGFFIVLKTDGTLIGGRRPRN